MFSVADITQIDQNRRQRVVLVVGTAAAACLLTPKTSAEAVRFFASQGACVGSTLFNKSECANAFINARAALRRSVGEPMDHLECVVRFKFCAKLGGGTRYVPVMLGVEMTESPAGWVSRAVLQVESLQIQAMPISHIVPEPKPEPARLASSPGEPDPTAERPDWLNPVASAFSDAVPDLSEQTRERDRLAKARRREEQRRAPMVY